MPDVPQRARRRSAVQPGVRAGQPGQAGHRPGPLERAWPGAGASAGGRSGRLPDQPAPGRPGAHRARARPGARAPPRPRLRHHHRLRLGRPRGGPGRLRRRRLLGQGRHRRVAACARRSAALPARRHGRPFRRHDRRRHDQRRPGGADAHRPGPGRFDLAAPPGLLHHRLRPQHHAHVGPVAGHRRARDDVQPRRQQLHGGGRARLLDRRPRGRPPLARPGPSRRPSRVAHRRALRHAHRPGDQCPRADRAAGRDLRHPAARRMGGEPSKPSPSSSGARSTPSRTWSPTSSSWRPSRWSMYPTSRAACPCWRRRPTSTASRRSPAFGPLTSGSTRARSWPSSSCRPTRSRTLVASGVAVAETTGGA